MGVVSTEPQTSDRHTVKEDARFERQPSEELHIHRFEFQGLSGNGVILVREEGCARRADGAATSQGDRLINQRNVGSK